MRQGDNEPAVHNTFLYHTLSFEALDPYSHEGDRRWILILKFLNSERKSEILETTCVHQVKRHEIAENGAFEILGTTIIPRLTDAENMVHGVDELLYKFFLDRN
ncbi:hypothetical protein AVEN_209720-1 [Araneus ventricosus]|uniref:Uncharacterized protein n=1 Tax=Araneus ventricosus TaxID=182803 RepID=A0A4Y2RK18_ARAVE|nr:hypothetical protein AVEN_209720-1 [Araneus ventricosus]